MLSLGATLSKQGLGTDPILADADNATQGKIRSSSMNPSAIRTGRPGHICRKAAIGMLPYVFRASTWAAVFSAVRSTISQRSLTQQSGAKTEPFIGVEQDRMRVNCAGELGVFSTLVDQLPVKLVQCPTNS
jgi:hypothetical protein